MEWNEIGTITRESLSAARLQAHYGALVLASTAHSLLEHRQDDSHTNLGVDVRTGSLITRSLDAESGVALALDLPAWQFVLRRGSVRLTAVDVAGLTLDASMEWVASQLRDVLTSRVLIERRQFPDFPESPIMGGEAFAEPASGARAELARWFGNGLGLFQTLDEPGWDDARVWPHHFDLGMLRTEVEGQDKMIGLGLSPGDEHHDQPYFYCSPYPAPGSTADLPNLGVGEWQTDGFVSAIVKGETLAAAPSQGEAATAYLRDALRACRELLA